MSAVLLFVLIFLATPALVFLGFFALYLEYRRKLIQRGFEVKLNAGETPALPERKNDHG